MTLEYIGNRAYESRLGEFGYNDETETEKALKIFDALEEMGYEIDYSVAGWAAVPVEDRKEFDILMKDYKEVKRKIH